MLIKYLPNIPSIIAGDSSQLREILNPLKEKLDIHYSLAWAQIKPGEKSLAHRLTTSEVYYILNGSGIMHINNEEKKVNENDTVYIPPNATQFIENTDEENLEFLCIVDPAWRSENEFVLDQRQTR